MYTIDAIEDAIMARLAPLRTGYEGDVPETGPVVEAAGTVRTIKTYQGELDSEEAIARATRLFPAIIVMYGGSEYDDHGARKIERATCVLFVCDKSLRTDDEARRGGEANPGAYTLLNAIRELLVNARLGLDIFPLELLRERPVWFGRGVSIYSAEYETAQALLYVGD